ncbi:hypothetical protein LCD36_04535 [Saccharopolyspora sp. 6T]|uniref:hypothetical protein n=1 Tax=Saccharopolyspora sp. 6T TaxID=2877238 RepID=UPI001CD2A2C7|nr:hypothetical protein [Saccharopolyspora sp. 6T]MCA1185719.1 hypothetical protein [Saccharopolyspora sp. 6T]
MRGLICMVAGVLGVALAGCGTGESEPQRASQPDYRAVLAGVVERDACTLLDVSPAMTACRSDMELVRDAMDQAMPALPHDSAGRLFNTASSARLRAQQYLDAGCGIGDTVSASNECSMSSRDAMVHTENLFIALG